MKVSIIIPSFKREHLLKWNLLSLAKQKLPDDYEIIVLNDGVHDKTEQLCKQYSDRLNIKYIFTGHRNLDGKLEWRVPGFVINIGVKQSTGDIILLCCAEIFHMNDSIRLLTDIYKDQTNNKALAIPYGKDDNGTFLNSIIKAVGKADMLIYERQPPLINVKFPFFLAMTKKVFIDIGGYDEDFTGTDYDDSDLIERLLGNGCYHVETRASVIHLWHPRLTMTQDRIPRFERNKKLYEERQGIIIRNSDREWGKL